MFDRPTRRSLRGQEQRWQIQRRRVVRALVMAGALAVVMTQIALGTTRPTYSIVTVRPGQSLWVIVASHYPESDPRQLIPLVEAANHLGSTVIYPGETLRLPSPPAS
ncbi:MAG: LysM peptidoglycan-binding domain-containing protein [Candidatus Dormibacteria bacterium]